MSHKIISVMTRVAAAFVLGVSIGFLALTGRQIYEEWQQKPRIIHNELIEHPSTIEENLAQLLGWHMLQLAEARRCVNLSERELDRLDARVRQLEDFINENNLPIPAEQPITINLIPLKIME